MLFKFIYNEKHRLYIEKIEFKCCHIIQIQCTAANNYLKTQHWKSACME